jgi:hypothetical protein
MDVIVSIVWFKNSASNSIDIPIGLVVEGADKYAGDYYFECPCLLRFINHSGDGSVLKRDCSGPLFCIEAMLSFELMWDSSMICSAFRLIDWIESRVSLAFDTTFGKSAAVTNGLFSKLIFVKVLVANWY